MEKNIKKMIDFLFPELWKKYSHVLKSRIDSGFQIADDFFKSTDAYDKEKSTD